MKTRFFPRFFPGILALENVFAKPLEWHLQVIAHIVQVHEVPNHLGEKSGTPVLLGFWHHWESLERMILCNWATTKLHLDSWNELKKGENCNLNFRAKNSFLIFTKYLKPEVKLHFFLKKIRAFTAFTLNWENHNKDKKSGKFKFFLFTFETTVQKVGNEAMAEAGSIS